MSFVVRALLGLMLLADFGRLRAQEPMRPEANSLIAHFQDNIERFSFMTCEYTCTKAKAKTAGDAFGGKWMPRQPGEYLFPNTAQFRLIKDRSNIRLEEIADDESKMIRREGHKNLTPDPKNPALASGPAFAFGSRSGLSNGTDSLSYSPREGDPRARDTVNFSDKVVPEWNRNLLVEIGGDSIGSLWRQAAASQKPIELRIAPHRGVECAWLTIHHPDGQRREYALDPARGHLPLCIIWSDAKAGELSRVEITEIKECSNGRWFPMRIVSYMTQGRGFWLATEYKVTKLDVDNRPSRESLMLDLPAGTAIMDVGREEPGKVTPTIYLKQNERIHPDEIPKLREMMKRKEENPLADTALRPPGVPWWKWALGGIGAALVLFAVVRIIRSRRVVGAA